MTFTDTVTAVVASTRTAATQLDNEALAVRDFDAALHGTLHRMAAVTGDCSRQISDLLGSLTPELRAKIDCLIIP